MIENLFSANVKKFRRKWCLANFLDKASRLSLMSAPEISLGLEGAERSDPARSESRMEGARDGYGKGEVV
jgi:hypothetical protein